MFTRRATVFVLGFVTFGLSGCVLPPAVTIATVMADIGSLITTEKTTSDHAISFVVKEDCRVWRGVAEVSVKAICFDEEETFIAEAKRVKERLGTSAASLQAQREGDLLASYAQAPISAESDELLSPGFESATAEPVEVATLRPNANPNADRVDSPPDVSSMATYLVVGSFRDVSNAERLAARLPLASVMPARVSGQLFQRVVAGPYTRDDLDSARTRARVQGIESSWAIDLCRHNLTPPPCQPVVL